MPRTSLPAPGPGPKPRAGAPIATIPTAGRYAVAIREAAKADREALTNALQAFAADSRAPDTIYARYTRMIYRNFGLYDKVKAARAAKADTRDLLTAGELFYVQSCERAIVIVITKGLALRQPRAEVKADIVAALEAIATAHRPLIEAERECLHGRAG